MYKVGRYEFKSKKHYESIIYAFIIAFSASLFLLFMYYDKMNLIIFGLGIVTCGAMIFHLIARLYLSRKYGRYVKGNPNEEREEEDGGETVDEKSTEINNPETSNGPFEGSNFEEVENQGVKN